MKEPSLVHRAATDEVHSGHVKRHRPSTTCGRRRDALIGLAAVWMLIVTIVGQGRQRRAQQQRLNNDFDALATRVLYHTLSDAVMVQWHALNTLAVAYTAQALARNESWPFVTLSSFSEQVSSVQRLSHASSIQFLPKVVDRHAWEHYARQHVDHWSHPNETATRRSLRDSQLLLLNRSHLFQASHATRAPSTLHVSHPPRLQFESGMASHIYTLDANGTASIDSGPGYYAPVWQSSPVARVNFNGLGDTADRARLVAAYEHGHASMGGSANVAHALHEWTIVVPVFDTFTSMRTNPVAALQARIERSWFDTAVSDSVILVWSGCHESWNGSVTDTALVKSATLSQLVQERLQQDLRLSLHPDACEPTVSVYPSDTFRSRYDSNVRFVYLWVVLFCGAIVFLAAHDRNRTTPEANKDRQLGTPDETRDVENGPDLETSENETAETSFTDLYASHSSRLYASLHGSDLEGRTSHTHSTAPILYPDATILLADLDGFAMWSANREPAAVLAFLHTIYKTLDGLAPKYSVHKAESIGDAYVAVTGVPNSQAHHATSMARFASDCLAQVRDLIDKLHHCFGPDTSEISIRIVLHSGPVTASVIRGDGAKFRLSGETVQGVALLERLGAPDRVLVSGATAELLTAVGKGRWLMRRECKDWENTLYGANDVRCISYWLNRPTKTSKRTIPSYEVSTDTRYDDYCAAVENGECSSDDQSFVARHTLALLTHYMHLIVARRAAALHASAACLDDVEELIDDDPNHDDYVGDACEIDDVVLAQLERLIGHIDWTFVPDKSTTCTTTLSMVKDFVTALEFDSDSTDETDLLGHVSLVFAAFVHDVMKAAHSNKDNDTAAATPAIRDDLPTSFSSFQFWDLFMADRNEELRLFFFADAVQQSQFLVSIVSAVGALEKSPSAQPPLAWTMDESEAPAFVDFARRCQHENDSDSIHTEDDLVDKIMGDMHSTISDKEVANQSQSEQTPSGRIKDESTSACGEAMFVDSPNATKGFQCAQSTDTLDVVGPREHSKLLEVSTTDNVVNEQADLTTREDVEHGLDLEESDKKQELSTQDFPEYTKGSNSDRVVL